MKQTMKTVVMALVAMSALSTAAEAQTDPNVWAWDFPMNLEIDAKPGQQAVTCQMHYFNLVKEAEGLEKKTMIWYDTTISEVGKGTTTIDEYGKKIEVPNALIVPLGKSEKAKKGDIVLTYAHGYHTMQRAIVIDDSTPTEPVVCFLDESWPDKVDSPKLAEKRKGEKLKPGTFNVLKNGKFEPGAQVAYKADGETRYGRIVQISGDKVLMSTWANRIDCTTKDNCTLLPLKSKIKAGDKVSAVYIYEFKPGYVVVKVDKEHGHLWVKKEGSESTTCLSLLEVMK